LFGKHVDDGKTQARQFVSIGPFIDADTVVPNGKRCLLFNLVECNRNTPPVPACEGIFKNVRYQFIYDDADRNDFFRTKGKISNLFLDAYTLVYRKNSRE
jgi:hypothetical protein